MTKRKVILLEDSILSPTTSQQTENAQFSTPPTTSPSSSQCLSSSSQKRFSSPKLQQLHDQNNEKLELLRQSFEDARKRREVTLLATHTESTEEEGEQKAVSTSISSWEDEDHGFSEDEKRNSSSRILYYGIMIALVALGAIAGMLVPSSLSAYRQQQTNSNIRDDNIFGTFSPTATVTPSASPTKTPNPSITPTLVPTGAPSITPQPTAFASRNPTGLPSSSPSLRPSRTPSDRPTVSPKPTFAPSPKPTESPTTHPSSSPTSSPTVPPTGAPSQTLRPTIVPMDPEYDFKLRLYWERGYMWQEEPDELWYCIECTKCDELGTGDGEDYGCEDRGRKSINCRDGDLFWVQRCRSNSGGARFNRLQVDPYSGRFQLRLDRTSLCMERKSNRFVIARVCDVSKPNQWWAPINSLNRFELRAYDQQFAGEREAGCLSQHHHPKSDEIVSMQNCRLSRLYETQYWEAAFD